MFKSKYLTAIIPLALLSCGIGKNEKTKVSEYPVHYAHGFEVFKMDGYTEVSIRNPWDTTRFLQTYILVNHNDSLPKPLPKGTLVRVPVQNVVAYASPHCGLMDELHVLDKLKGVCESRYIDLPYVREKVRTGEIIDLGEASAPDVERLIELQPDIIMTSPFQNVSYGRVGKTNIPLIECADYMESTPLGRAEWIRFHALFHQREEFADSLFNETVRKYTELQRKAQAAIHKPTMFAERKTGASWFVPGGNSYMANLYKDAGAEYVWHTNENTGSIPLSFEEVFEQAAEADYWLIKYNASQPLTYQQLQEDFRLNGEFAAFKNQNIYICNTGEVPFYEEMPLHPDRLLSDLVWIFHPELMNGYSPLYFQKMKNPDK